MRQLPVTAAFGHALRSTFDNIAFAFHVSWPWMLAIFPITLAGNIYLEGQRLLRADPLQMTPTEGVVGFLMLIPTTIAFASIAVAWHRYILLDEVPEGWQRLRLDGTVWRYIGNSYLIALILGLIGAALAFVLVFFGAILQQLLGNAILAILIPAVAVALTYLLTAAVRLSIKLPAVALEERSFTLRNAWELSAGNTWRILGLIALLFLVVIAVGAITTGIGLVLGAATGPAGVALSVAVEVVVNWVLTILNVTLLTSLYGFFAEKRDF